MKVFFFAFLLIISTASFGQSLEELASYIQGSYSSEAQSSSSDEYINVNLHMYEIWSDWSEHHDEIWFYVEQAVASKPNEPYRQRAYLLTENEDKTFNIAIYEFHNPSKFAGKWKQLKFFDMFDNTVLSEKEGCDITLKNEGDKYTGSTSGKNCKTDWQGATYVQSDVTISSKALTSWDRGLNDEGKQVWGPAKGGYKFIKK